MDMIAKEMMADFAQKDKPCCIIFAVETAFFQSSSLINIPPDWLTRPIKSFNKTDFPK